MLDDGDSFFDVMMSLVDVKQSAMLQAARAGTIFFFGNVTVSLVEKLESLVKTTVPGHVCIDGYVIVDIFVVINGSLLDFVDGVVDFVNGVLFLSAKSSTIGTLLEVSASIAQIGKRVKIRGMLLGGRGSRKEKNCSE